MQAYLDMYGVKTIGWGYTGERTPSKVPNKITYDEAEKLFESDLSRFTKKANEIVLKWDLHLSQQQYDAAVMYAFQHGQNGAGPKSLTALMKAMVAGDNDAVRSTLSGWGRAEDEWELYLSGDYTRNH